MTNAIINGGFELGGVVSPPYGWTLDNGYVASTSYTTHSGTFKCQFYDYGTDNNPGKIEQAIPNIPVSSIKKFGLWYQTFDNGATQYLKITITYSDASTWNSGSLSNLGSYVYLDILAAIDITKSVAKITMEQVANGTALYYVYVDDVDLEVGQGGGGAAGMNTKAMMFFWLMSALGFGKKIPDGIH